MGKKKAQPNKPIGRPKKPEGESKTQFLQVRLLELERDGFAEAARLAGIPLSTWVRERLRIVARKELQEYGKRAEFLDE